ncbi:MULTISPECIES: hypothetical protein [Pedobacter]|uniref:Uncharacterized protein n=1 Tax=Pedobacter heparinus (strain ATCC 13125 / DSM 2366 / CIP 104194 / JCM 7457 / NBRC 12017 / NCIMB 9290 / NRRL B-14731 / HIM 762-3) TaxID=485917 RepID=C6Y374_PEDHD|nr:MULTISPECIES: hypothetical protein [Pedobacter]ACU05299.1 hypothetical protein Phep_3102 [Pedobacter heparinus DSM 2366]MBB5439567.1 hypothetical protein [Pedobacter sp. AK017]
MKHYYKKLPAILFLFVLSTNFYGCKKSKKETPGFTCTSCKTIPDAKVENNSLSKGVYKGVVMGSTGVISIDIMNNGTGMQATMVLDGLTINFTSTAVWTNGQPLVADFTAVSNSKTYSFRFTVAANGGSPAAGSFNIPDHPSIFFQLVKETSDNLIKCYEGSTEGVKNSGAKQSGSLNVIVSSKTNTWIGLSRDAASNSSTVVSGTITGTVINCDCGPETTVKGTFSNDEIKGTYKGSDNSGTWSAKRTL